MKLLCRAIGPTPEQLQRLGFDPRHEHLFDVTPGKEYVVIALTFLSESLSFGRGTTVEIIDDFDRWALAPLILFDIVDPRLSRYWIARKIENGDLALCPESFFREYYHDDLTDGVPEVVSDFERVRALVEDEFPADP